MFILKRILCRTFQLSFRAALPILPYREPKLLPSCDRIPEAFTKHKPSAVLIVTTAGTEKRGLIAPIVAALTAEGIGYAIYNKTQPDPTARNVEEALAIYREQGCEALIAVGGGELMNETISCVDFEALKKAEPKWYMGYSDNTNMIFPMATLNGVPGIYGPNACGFVYVAE
jgi:alcohol dehydrogenase class IV